MEGPFKTRPSSSSFHVICIFYKRRSEFGGKQERFGRDSETKKMCSAEPVEPIFYNSSDTFKLLYIKKLHGVGPVYNITSID